MERHTRLEAIAIRLEAIATRVEAIAFRLEAVASLTCKDQAEAEANAMACRHHFARQVLENLLALQTSPNLDGHPN